MRALIIVHDPGSTAGLVGERLVHHGYELVHFLIASSIHDARADVTFPDPGDYDLIVPMGAIWSVYDHDTIGSWIDDELAFLRAADTADVPVLGICFGGQAIATALGGKVVPSDEAQIGWHQLESTVPGGIAEGPWMQWHYDRFEAPAGSDILAQDSVGIQAFRLRRNLGLQFHPEVTRAHLKAWLDMGGDDETAALGDIGLTIEGLLDGCDTNVPLATPNTNQLVDWFLAEIAPSPVG